MGAENLKTPLAQVKGLGSIKEGSHHWLMQRITALALIPLVFLIMSFIVKVALAQDFTQVVRIFNNIYNVIFTIIFIVFALYHGCLGIRVIVEDYIHCHSMKFTVLILTNFVSIFCGLACIIAILNMHFSAMILGYLEHLS